MENKVMFLFIYNSIRPFTPESMCGNTSNRNGMSRIMRNFGTGQPWFFPNCKTI
jgi:hypothetical protein